MISFKYLNKEISFDDLQIQLLVIENKVLFRKVISCFEYESAEDYFVFSEAFEPFDFVKKGTYISNPLNINTENKKLVTKANSYLENITNNEYYNEIADIKMQLANFADLLIRLNDYDFSYEADIDTMSIIKLLGFKIKRDSGGSIELLLRYILLTSKYLKCNFFVIPNLHLFFESAEIKLFYDTLLLNHICVLVIECAVPVDLADCEQLHIIDKDLCQIDI